MGLDEAQVLPSDLHTEESIRRKRGRPRKQISGPVIDMGPTQAKSIPSVPPPEKAINRKRGRPRKQISETSLSMDQDPIKRTRGRPRKQISGTSLNMGQERKRGRPRKQISGISGTSLNMVQERKRGRPRKQISGSSLNMVQERKSGRPRMPFCEPSLEWGQVRRRCNTKFKGAMREFEVTKISTSRQMDIIKTNLEVWSKELEEAYQEHTVEYVPQSFLNSGASDSEEPEEDPEEEPEEDPDEEPEVETEEKLEEGSEVEPEEDSEVDLNEEPEEELDVECARRSHSCHKTIVTEQLIEYPDEDPSEEHVSEPSFENDPKEDDQICSNGKKRALDKTAFKAAPLQNYQTKKKCMYEEIVKQDVDFGYAAADPQSKSGMPEAVVGDVSGFGKQENAGNSGKRRRSRWDQPCEEDGDTDKGDREGKKCKTRWADDDSPLKFLGPLQLPDLGIDLGGSELDPDVQGLKTRLSEVNSKLERSEVHDDRPEAERSPSQPEYTNLGIRVNTREVRLRKKLIQERQWIMMELIKKKLSFEISAKYNPVKLCTKLYIPVKEYPNYNFIGLILGPNGNTQKRMQKETGAKIRLRSKGFIQTPTDDDLHVYIEAGSRESLDAAVSMVEKLLIPTEEGMSDHKRAQLQELAKLKKENVIITLCSMCKEPGHDHYDCPQRKPTLKASCGTCGSICQSTSGCPLSASPQVSNPLQTSPVLSTPLQTSPVLSNPLQTSPVLSNPHQTTPVLNFGPAPNTKGKFYKEISAANLYVGYLPRAVDESRLRDLFSPFGTITQSKVVRDYTTGLSRGYGFVTYDTPTAAASAIMYMNGFQIDGHMLAVRVAGVPPAATVSPAISLGPVYPGPAAVIPSVPSWPVLPQLMLPEAQMCYPNNGEGLVFPPSSVYLEHNSQFPQIGAAVIPPPGVSRAIESETANSSTGSVSVSQFPVDPNSQLSWFVGNTNIRTSPWFHIQSNVRTEAYSTFFFNLPASIRGQNFNLLL